VFWESILTGGKDHNLKSHACVEDVDGYGAILDFDMTFVTGFLPLAPFFLKAPDGCYWEACIFSEFLAGGGGIAWTLGSTVTGRCFFISLSYHALF